VQGIAGFPKVVVSADGRGVVSHVGARLLADVAQATGLVAGFDEVARTRRVRRSAHLPGQVLAEVAVLIADGGQAIADLAVLRNQPGLFGLVASPATCWRVLDAVDADMLAALSRPGRRPESGRDCSAARPAGTCRSSSAVAGPSRDC
jgi:hypothetical protein